MKVAYCSDLHLEFGDIELFNTEGASVLVLAGDICVIEDLKARDTQNIFGENTKSNMFHRFFQHCAEQFPHVLYILGNHEHYHGDFYTTAQTVRERLGYIKTLHFLDQTKFVLDDVVFFGGTLWTDMNREDPVTLMGIRSVMNDFRVIRNSGSTTTFRATNADGNAQFKTRVSKFAPSDSVDYHKDMLMKLSMLCDCADPGQRVVVVGHHTPSFQSCAPEYVHDTMVNGAYHSDLSEFILDRPVIHAWIHGHTHDPYDYEIGSTRVLCNPRGYKGYETAAYNFQLKYFEV